MPNCPDCGAPTYTALLEGTQIKVQVDSFTEEWDGPDRVRQVDWEENPQRPDKKLPVVSIVAEKATGKLPVLHSRACSAST